MNHEGFASDRHTFAQAHVNVVMASLALLTGSCATGTVTCGSPFEPEVEHGTRALLEAATAMQTEVSLSIFASDPLIKDASSELRHQVDHVRSTEEMELMILGTDALIQEWLGLLNGRGQELEALANLLVAKGSLTLPEIADYLRVK